MPTSILEVKKNTTTKVDNMIKKNLTEGQILQVESVLALEGLIKTSPDNHCNFYNEGRYKAYWFDGSDLKAITEGDNTHTYLLERF